MFLCHSSKQNFLCTSASLARIPTRRRGSRLPCSQTAEYARARFAQSITVFKVPNDIDEAVRARVRRQELNLAQPQEIELYSGIFDQMAAVASYGRAARAIVTRVIDDLAPEIPEDGS